jgi:hypothetical protein
MQIETDEPEVIARVAALDGGKAEVVCCARVPGPGGRRMQEVRTTSTVWFPPDRGGFLCRFSVEGGGLVVDR